MLMDACRQEHLPLPTLQQKLGALYLFADGTNHSALPTLNLGDISNLSSYSQLCTEGEMVGR